MQVSKIEYQQFLIDIINNCFVKAEHPIDEMDILQALTGRRIGMESVDMLTLYTILEECTECPLLFDDIYVFWNIDSLATYLMNLNDEKLIQYVKRGGWSNE